MLNKTFFLPLPHLSMGNISGVNKKECGLRQTAAVDTRSGRQNITSHCDCWQSTASSAISALKLSLTLSPLAEGGKNVKVERRCRPRGELVYFCILKRCALNTMDRACLEFLTRSISTYSTVQFMSLHPASCNVVRPFAMTSRCTAEPTPWVLPLLRLPYSFVPL